MLAPARERVLDRDPVSRDRVNEVASCAEPFATLAPLGPLGRRPEHRSRRIHLSLRAMGILDQADGAISTG